MTDSHKPIQMASSSNGQPLMGGEEEKRETVAQIAARLRQGEDFNLAYTLQEEEFRAHYSKNKDQRANMAKDGKMSRREQMAELERLQKERSEMARRDELLALELAKEMEREERRARMEQAKRDAELARKMQSELASKGSKSTEF